MSEANYKSLDPVKSRAKRGSGDAAISQGEATPNSATPRKEILIDAAGKTLGRVASEAAKALMGKTSADYTPHIRSDVHVKIVNAGKIYMRARKRSTKTYQRYSGYPSGRTVETYAALSLRRGADQPLRQAIKRMLPRNTFLTARMKQLEIIV